MHHPKILIPGATRTDETVEQLYINRAYTNAIEHAGGIPLLIARPKSDEVLDEIILLADGLLLIGGHDIDPQFYGEKNRECKNIDRERDLLEMSLFRKALEQGIPVLGICRGLQIMNVASGGSLYQDVQKEMPGAILHDYHKMDGVDLPRNHRAHEVNIIPDSLLSNILNTATVSANSLHHQGIKQIAPGFAPAATAPDGLVEAITHTTHPFALGIEWHPEELNDEPSRKLFAAFIASAKQAKENRSH